MSKPPKVNPEKLSFEEAYAELVALVEDLESEQHPLEESIALFERGQELIKRCAGLLESADLRVRKIAGDAPTDFAEED